jgi:hypothetical protein
VGKEGRRGRERNRKVGSGVGRRRWLYDLLI